MASPEKDPSQRIVITGMGLVSPLGLNVEQNWQSLMADNPVPGLHNIRESVFSSYDQLGTTLAGTVEDFDIKLNEELAANIDDKELKRTIHRSAQFSVWAGAEALAQAQLLDENYRIDAAKVRPNKVGVRIGTGIGGGAAIGDARMMIEDGKRIRPWSILQVLPERVATVPGKVFGLKGPTSAVISACATGNANMIAAYKDLLMGDAKVVLAGGVEAALDAVGIGMFEGTSAVDQETDPMRASLPLHTSDEAGEKAGGMIMSEGGGLVVMETLQHARERGVKPLVELVSYSESSDAEDDTNPSGEGAVVAMIETIERGQLEAIRKVIIGHLTGTGGDQIEVRSVKEVVGEEEVYLWGPKSWTGHLLGGSGSATAILGGKILETGILPPNKAGEYPIEIPSNINVLYRHTEIEDDFVIINNSFGFGGLNAVIALARVRGV